MRANLLLGENEHLLSEGFRASIARPSTDVCLVDQHSFPTSQKMYQHPLKYIAELLNVKPDSICSKALIRLCWNIVVYRPVAGQWLCKCPLHGNTRYVHARNKRRTGLCNPFLRDGLVNAPSSKRRFLFPLCEVVTKKWLESQFRWVKWWEAAGWQMREVSCQFSVGSQPVKRRLISLCGMAAYLGPS
jgi:hypothetical protein